MRVIRIGGIGLIGMILACGCEPPAPTTQPASPTTAAAAAPATTPASTRPVGPSEITIDDEQLDFPPASLTVMIRDDQMVAVLFSDDPPQAAGDDYTGNSYFLEMPLQTPQSGTLSGSTWDFQAQDNERVESINGVFLKGRRFVLQPLNTHAEFDGSTTPIRLKLRGSFNLFDDSNADAPPRLVELKAEILAQLRAR